MTKTAQLLLDGMAQIGIRATSLQTEQLQQYVELLIKWNKTYNLIANTAPGTIAVRHMLDSLAIAPYLCGDLVLDVGSGAGLPGIPLAICFSEKKFILLDSQIKRVHFLRYVQATLKLNNVEVVHARIENYAPEIRFSTIVSRAFAKLTTIIKLTARLLQADGCILAMQGKLEKVEVKESVGYIETIRLRVPFLQAERHLIKVTGIKSG